MKRLLFAALTLTRLGADPIHIAEPSADRWMYLSNSTPGTRGQASTFSALPASSGVDDRFGFFLIRFDTAALLPAGLPPESYLIRRITLTASIGQDLLFSYDPTPDPLESFGTPTTPASLPDPDPGRPVELHGAGFRNDWTAATFQENSPNGPATPGARNAYPLGFDPAGAPRDVSNHVTEGFDSVPWATGVCELEAGEPVPLETAFTFDLDPALPGVCGYLQQGLADGRLWFSLSSLHPATQQGGEFVAWLTRDDAIHQFSGGLAPRLTLEVGLALPLQLEWQEGSPRLSWPEFPGFTHSLQASTDLTPQSWFPLQSHAATTAATASFIDSEAAPRRFYRLEILPTP